MVRTKLAVQQQIRGGDAPRYRGTAGTLRRVFHEEGLRGLFRGITPAVIAHAPAAGVFFTTYTFVKTHVASPETLAMGMPYLPDSLPKDTMSSSLGAGAGWATTCLLLNPLFVLKTKQQTQLVRASPNSPLKYTGLMRSFRVVIAEQGVRGLYVGAVASMAGAPGAMIQMPLYEHLKRLSLAPDEVPSHTRIALSSAMSSCCVGMVMYPMEVVRLRLQAQGPSSSRAIEYKGIVDCFKKIFVNEGFRSLYRGMSSSVIRTVPQSAIGLSCYETILRLSTSILRWYDS